MEIVGKQGPLIAAHRHLLQAVAQRRETDLIRVFVF
jgi:hypothetical protein